MPNYKMPSNFGDKARELWQSIARDYELKPDELRVLEDACREADIIGRLEKELLSAPLMVRGSQGQLVASPLVSEVRQHRAVLRVLLKFIDLPTDDGRSQSEKLSEANRRAVRSRWDKQRKAG